MNKGNPRRDCQEVSGTQRDHGGRNQKKAFQEEGSRVANRGEVGAVQSRLSDYDDCGRVTSGSSNMGSTGLLDMVSLWGEKKSGISSGSSRGRRQREQSPLA